MTRKTLIIGLIAFCLPGLLVTVGSTTPVEYPEQVLSEPLASDSLEALGLIYLTMGGEGFMTKISEVNDVSVYSLKPHRGFLNGTCLTVEYQTPSGYVRELYLLQQELCYYPVHLYTMTFTPETVIVVSSRWDSPVIIPTLEDFTRGTH